jgi:ABC-type transporter Mla subunit MlaD
MKEKLQAILKKLDKNVNQLDDTLSDSSLKTVYKDLSEVKDTFDEILTEMEEFIGELDEAGDKE